MVEQAAEVAESRADELNAHAAESEDEVEVASPAYDDEEESKVAVRALGDQGLPGLRPVGSAREEIGNAVDDVAEVHRELLKLGRGNGEEERR